MADYSEEVIKKIWQKAIVQENNNPDVFRHDYAGAWIRRDDYEKQGEFGWTIEEIVPSEHGGDSTDEDNLMPVFWKNKLSRKNYEDWVTRWKAEGNKNVEFEQSWVLG